MLRTTNRWNLVGAFAVAALVLAYVLIPDYRLFVEGVVSKLVKAAIGGYFGYLVSRYVTRLDLSDVVDERRPLAGVSQAILIVGFAVAVAGLF